MYHNNEDTHILSRVELMCNSKGSYAHLFNCIETVVTSAEDSALDEALNSTTSQSLVLHSALIDYDSHTQMVPGKRFTSKMLHCPTKSVSKEWCSGRFLQYLCKQSVANIKKHLYWITGG